MTNNTVFPSSQSEKDPRKMEGIALLPFGHNQPGYASMRTHDTDYTQVDDHDEFDQFFDDYVPKPTLKSVCRNWKRIIMEKWKQHVEPYELYLAVAVLILSTTVERVTFKIMIDRMIPYKFILLEIIFIMSWAIFGLLTAGLELTTHEITEQMKTFPQEKVFMMALLDSLQFYGVVYSGIGVSPTMTIILLHASTLLILVGSRIVFPDRHYGWYHRVGVVFISIAVTCSIFKIVYYDYLYNSDGEDGFIATKSALIYVFSCGLQGVSTLYKERALVDWAQPVNIYFISSRLFLYQFLVTLSLSIVFFVYEAIIGNSDRIPSGLFYGWKCFLGSTPTDINRDDDMTSYYVSCSHSLWLVMGYVLATIGVMMSINVVLRLNSLLVSKAICAAICVAFVVLWLYDVSSSPFQSNPFVFGGSVGAVDLVSMAVLLVGMEVYGRDPEPDVELITNYVTASPISTSSRAESEVEDQAANDPHFRRFQPLQKK
jgi:hypothetical protein